MDFLNIVSEDGSVVLASLSQTKESQNGLAWKRPEDLLFPTALPWGLELDIPLDQIAPGSHPTRP